jgi:hypothetical protein
MQSSDAAVAYLQPTISVALVVYSTAATTEIKPATTAARAQAKPAYNNSTAEAAITVTPDEAGLVQGASATTGASEGENKRGFSMIGAAESGWGYFKAGTFWGGAGGCVVGAEFAIVGCVPGTAVGALGGGIGFGVWGVVEGGFRKSDAKRFSNPYPEMNPEIPYDY